MNRRLFLQSLSMGTGLFVLNACRPKMSIPFAMNHSTPLPSPKPIPRHPEVLLEKAMGHERQMGERHLSPEGLVWYKIREEGAEVVNLPDAAIWTGCYVAAEAFRWAVTGEPEAKGHLKRSLKALHLLQQVTGKKGLLARAFRKGNGPSPEEQGEWHQGEGDNQAYRWLGDVSIDQVDGVLFGYALAFDLLQDGAVRDQIAADVAAISDHILDHGMKIIDIDGRPTKHGDLGSGLLTEDLNALIALMAMKVAHHVTQGPRFHWAYQGLIRRKGYHHRAAAARDKWWEYLIGINHSDNNLAFLAFYPLMRLEKDPTLQKVYQKGLQRAWQVVRPEANPLFTFITHALLPEDQREPIALERALETLFFFQEVKRNIQVKNSRRPEICQSFWKDRRGRPQACAPLPIQDRPADSFEWKANPYRLDGGGDGKTFYAGVDYLLPYWMGRHHRFLSPLV